MQYLFFIKFVILNFLLSNECRLSNICAISCNSRAFRFFFRSFVIFIFILLLLSGGPFDLGLNDWNLTYGFSKLDHEIKNRIMSIAIFSQNPEDTAYNFYISDCRESYEMISKNESFFKHLTFVKHFFNKIFLSNLFLQAVFE